MSKRWMAWTLLALGGGALGCAGTREVPKELAEARSDVEAVNRSDARTYAPSEAADAQRYLRSAECSLLTRQGVDKVKLRASEASEQAVRACAVAKENRTLAEASAAADEAAQEEARAAAAQARSERDALVAARTEAQSERDALEARSQQKAEELAAAEAEIQRLKDELGFKETQEGQVLTMSGSTLFKFDSADLLDAAEPRLEQVAEVLLEVEQPLVLEGHTDAVGDTEYNRELSARRAESVKDFLVDAGVPSERISIQALGENDPIASNDSVEGRALNRRVELVLPEAMGGSGPAPDDQEDTEPAPPHQPGDPTTILPEPDLPIDSGALPETLDDGTGGSGLPEPETPLEDDPYPLDYEQRMHSAPDGLGDDGLQVAPEGNEPAIPQAE